MIIYFEDCQGEPLGSREAWPDMPVPAVGDIIQPGFKEYEPLIRFKVATRTLNFRDHLVVLTVTEVT